MASTVALAENVDLQPATDKLIGPNRGIGLRAHSRSPITEITSSIYFGDFCYLGWRAMVAGAWKN
jgi:hypothetical protein